MEEEKDEEISLDFSKIKRFFKRKKVYEIKDAEAKAEKAKEEIEENIEEEKEHLAEELAKEKGIKDGIKELKEEKEEIEAQEKKLKLDEKKAEAIDKDLEDSEEKVSEAEEVSIDLSAVKNFFKKKKSSHKTESEDEISFDIRKIIAFFRKNQILLLILIPLILSIYLRVMPAYLPVTDDWAQSSVDSYFRSQIKAQIDQVYPHLPDANKEPLIEEEFKKFLKENKDQYNQQLKGTSDYFKSRLQNENSQTYLIAIDPYFWMRNAQNIIDNGHVGDELRENNYSGRNEPYDNHMIAPIGRFVPDDMFHAFLEAYTFKFMRIFNKDIELMKVAFFMPVILAALAVIPAFFIARKIGGNFAGFLAGMIIAVHPSFMTRTVGGFSDTDPYNVLLPLFIALFFLLALKSENIKKALMFGSIGGLFIGLYSFAWGGWWFMFHICIATGIIYLLYRIIVSQKNAKKSLVIPLVALLALIVTSGIFVTAFTNFETFSLCYKGAVEFTKIKDVGTQTVWPNVFTTVAEQNEVDVAGIISNIGGKLLLFISLIGLTLALFTNKKVLEKKDWFFVIISGIYFLLLIQFMPHDVIWALILIAVPFAVRIIQGIIKKEYLPIGYTALLLIWIAAPFYASTKGVRWTLLMIPPLAIGIGVALGIVCYTLNNWIAKELHINKNISISILVIAVILLIAGPIKAGYITAYNEVPSMNDAWFESLEGIRQDSSENAIITSWWDFGHWFKMIADRPVTFDGTSQDTPMAHWVGLSLQTDNEDLSMGILRMLDCGSNNAFDELDKVIQQPYKSVDILYEMFVLEKDDAKELLENKGLSGEEADAVIKYTHCEPPEGYYITSSDMIGKSGVWGHFGLWDFKRATMFNVIKNRNLNMNDAVSYLVGEFNMTEENAKSIYFEVRALGIGRDANDWIANWPGYQGSSSCSSDNKTATCPFLGGSMKINLKTYDAVIPTQKGDAYPNSIVYLTEDDVFEKHFEGNLIGLSVLLIPKGDSNFEVMAISPELVNSVFTRLYFLQGHALSHFELLSDKKSVTGDRIVVWRVNWDGGEKLVLDAFKEPESAEETIMKEPEEALANETTAANNNKTTKGTADNQTPEETTKNATASEEENAENTSESNDVIDISGLED